MSMVDSGDMMKIGMLKKWPAISLALSVCIKDLR